MRNMHELLTPSEVASILKVTEPTLARWRYVGSGPSYSKVGKHCRYRIADVQQWIESQTVEAVPASA